MRLILASTEPVRALVFTAAAIALGLATLGITPSAEAAVGIAIDLTHQRMHVTSANGSYDWPISSARRGFSTPGGSYAPTHLERMHYSKKYHMSPMPHAIFFRGGYAIHGTSSVGELGRPASHGCVRLSPGHAAALFAMVQAEGARISIAGTPPASRPFQREREPHTFVARRFVPRDIAGYDRPPSPSRRASNSSTHPDAPAAGRVRAATRAGRGDADTPGYGYRAVYNHVPVRVYVPAYTYAPIPYAPIPYAPAPSGYVSSPQVIGGPAQPPLVPYYGE